MKKKRNKMVSYKALILIMILSLIVATLVLLILDLNNVTKYIKLSSEYDWLSYIGAIIGGFTTFIGVIITIKYENNNRIEELSITLRPIIEPVINADYRIEGYHSQIVLEQKDISKNIFVKNIEMIFQNKGRGEAINLRIKDILIYDCPETINLCLKEYNDKIITSELLKEGYLFVYIGLPSSLYISSKKNIEESFKIELIIEYSDLYGYYSYEKSYFITINIREMRCLDKSVSIKNKKYYYHDVNYKLEGLIQIRNESDDNTSKNE